MILKRIAPVLLALASPLGLAEAAGARDIETITRPSKEIVLKFLMPGRIAEVLVKDGQQVQKGQLLVRMDDEAEQIQLKQLEAEAKDETRVQAAKAEEDLEQAFLEELRATPEAGTTRWELYRQELKVKIAGWKHKLAVFERDKYQLRLDEARVRASRMELRSPFAGTVERMFVKEGAATNSLEEIIWLVQSDPLWIEAPVDLDQARGLKLDQLAEVTFPGQAGKPVRAKIVHKASVADAGKLMVRLEVPNPTSRPAGETVTIRFPDEIAETVTQKAGQPALKPTDTTTVANAAEAKGVIDG